MTTAYHAWVHLADHEWGNELMDQAAREMFAAHPDKDLMAVEVHEHAGWYLTYDRSGRCVGTANDGWPGDDHARAFWRAFNAAAEVKYISVRRPNRIPQEV